ncbi:MAG: hypothetical protein ABIQ40_04295 [Bacteroidia bacterium]
MFTEEENNQSNSFGASTFAAIKTMLEEKQRKIEEQTGEKLSLEEVFSLYRDTILGKESEGDVIIPGQHRATFPDGLPGYRFNQEPGYFLPDIPALSLLSNWGKMFYPKSEYTIDEIEKLTQLYLDPKFQRTASSLQGRLYIMMEAEGMSNDEFASSVAEENSKEFLFNLSPMFLESPEGQKALDQLVNKYGKSYGERWIRGNETPLSKKFLAGEWISGRSIAEVWWKYTAPMLSHEKGIRDLEYYPTDKIDRELKWLYCQPKFSKLSGSLAGRMDIICAMSKITPEELADETGLALEILKKPEKNEDEIINALIQRYGNEHGAVWLAYGLDGLDAAFAIHAIANDFRFLRSIPAIFRPSRYIYQRSNADTELNGTEAGTERYCLNCGASLTGRIDKRFHSGACQRAYYRKQAKQEYLDGLDESEETSQAEEVQEEPKKEGLIPLLGDTLGGFANAAAGMLLERAVGHFADTMFGAKKETGEDKKSQ